MSSWTIPICWLAARGGQVRPDHPPGSTSSASLTSAALHVVRYACARAWWFRPLVRIRASAIMATPSSR